MPLFRFEVRTPTHVMLTHGMELADHTAARVEAAKRIGTLLHDHAGEVWLDQEWQMDVTNETGLLLYVIQVNTMKSAATQGS
ncbi:hypothetical protein ASG43_17705 [Aureimonas sp. Leaf454]|uniref:DUF6894 family protein n=1 Tax=Aureimonas sp. Leaf454 TaxID=1736381 RepID=UPI0006F47BB1|nr:hypothetical protein [Aureimonas sp. Leaf454]KQT53673.1 hypothetical protein ASG43_17705 [Aureimonas sp. Leaf454]